MKQVSLKVKLIGGFAVVALICLVVGFTGWLGVGKVGTGLEEISGVRMPAVESLLTISWGMEKLRVSQRTLLNPDLDTASIQRQFDNVAKARELYGEAWKVYEALPKTADQEKIWQDFVKAVGEWKIVNDKFFAEAEELAKADIGNPMALRRDLQRFQGDHYKLLCNTIKLIMTGQSFEGGEDDQKCNFGQWKVSYVRSNAAMKAALEESTTYHQQFHAGVAKIKGLVAAQQIEEAKAVLLNELEPMAEKTFGIFDKMLAESARVEGILASMNQDSMVEAREKQDLALSLLNQLVQANEKMAEDSRQSAMSSATLAKGVALAGMFIGFFVALILGVVLSLSINRPLQRVIEELTAGADQVSSASQQVSGASQQLAEGASEQAAAIEETSSSLEEMTSMTRQNADNADQANMLMAEAGSVALKASDSMTSLTRSMDEISRASEDTSKIVKTIDEIAFQTNLLALNAAVEAARAGEAGAGFAVVADEVRNLAMRAAEAAKNTASLIEDTVKKVGAGSELVQRTNSAFGEMSHSVSKVGELVGEIAAASKEQAQGIEQINTAVTQMDKVTQQTAANAEESASASEELNAQAESMHSSVGELMKLVSGGDQASIARRSRQLKKTPERDRHPAPPRLKGKAGAPPHGPARATGAPAKAKVVTPEEMIPMDDDFGDF